MVTVHLVVPTTTKFEFAAPLSYLEGPDLKLMESHLERGPASIECEYDELVAGPETVAAAIRAQNDGADAIVVVCMGDPALHAVREAVSVPVLGIGETAMHYAAMLGHKFSILCTLDRRRSYYVDKARQYGLDSKLASVRTVNTPVLAIEDDHASTLDRLVEAAAVAIIQDGADVIVLGCGCFKDMDRMMEERLAARGLAVPVIDSPPLTVLTAAALARTRLSHSKRAYPIPPAKERPGYDVPSLKERR
ncbi:Asp/Glu racemase [Phenylobacterium zucineum HLK1]|uniref:Asp/Glu racemase n=1 Tax=Phenylobacterium zucineum (strain HLK1) TaxID=450851 RepID=B4RGE2_PHEZH|nr:aspartate/glutamate racemase family protein [Phenylobacterium zucineum]ACG78848.1 Asp/Glu racemase [Phenylobacterium zucineum HLK1]